VLGREVPAGARLLVADRAPQLHDAQLVRGRDGLFVGAPRSGDRPLGVIEAVLAPAS